MWPWSRIAELKRMLAEAIAESDNWESRAVSAEKRWTMLNEGYERLDERRLAILGEMDRLRAELAKALKNDHHDPKTGRFVKGKS